MRIYEKNRVSEDSNDIYVYIVNLNNFLVKKTLFWRYLSEEEKAQANQYFTDTLKERYIISHGVLREILSFYIQKPPHEIIFIKNNYGKPFLKGSSSITSVASGEMAVSSSKTPSSSSTGFLSESISSDDS